jgi:4-amino-4-deoxy-L-arabinose transferase-like glycosyltransferase
MSIEKLLPKILQATRQPKDIFLLFLLVLLLLWQPSYLHQQLNLYELGLYLPGIDAVSQGQVPFRDFFHLRGPFELYVPALFMKIFGFRVDVLATCFYLGTVLTILVAVLIAYELIHQRVLLYSFVLIIVTRTFPRVVFTCWGGMRYAWGLLAVWCLIRFLKSNRPGWLLAAGCLAATAMLTSIEIGVIVLIAFMAAAVMGNNTRLRSRRNTAWVFLCGFLAVTLPYGIYLLSQNAVMPYLQAQWTVVTHMQKTFVQLDRTPDTVPKFLHAVFFPLDKSFYQMTPVYCYMSFFFLYFWRMFNKKVTALEQATLVVAVYGLILFLTGFRKIEFVEYEMSLQPEKIVLFFLLGQFIVWANTRFARFKWVGTVLLAAVIISSAIYFVGRFKTRYYKTSWVYQLIPGKDKGKQLLINGAFASPIDLPRIKNMAIPLWQAEDLEQLKSFVDEHVPAHEAVWMYPELGSLHFILDRPWVGRFPTVTLSWMDEGWFADYEKALEDNPPRYAIFTKEKLFYFDTSIFLVPANRVKHERMMQFLYHHYVIEGQTPSYLIYRRITMSQQLINDGK